MRNVFLLPVVLLALSTPAAERTFPFGDDLLDKQPPGFQSTVAGAGTPGEWKVIMDEVPPSLEPRTAKAPQVTSRPVLAQMSRSPIDHHFPILVFEDETFGDFKLTTRFKVAGGGLEQMAGIVFRYQNESNFCVVRASVLGKNFRCYRVDNGVLKPPIGPQVEIAKGEWHEMAVECEGTRITCWLDGKEAIKLVDNPVYNVGKIGFWTKSDSVSYFADARIVYTPRKVLAQSLIEDAKKEYPRVLGLNLYLSRVSGQTPLIVGTTEEGNLGKAGSKTEEDVIRQGTSYFSKDKRSVSVTMPLRDRNGEPIAAVRVTMESFPGQTEQSAVIRAQPIVKLMQQRVQSLDQLVE